MTGDPYGVEAARQAVKDAQAFLSARLAVRDADIVRTVHAGATHKVTAELFGVTAPRVTQIMREAERRLWGEPVLVETVPVTHASMADAARLAQHAQQLRCESATGMAGAEVRAFYGHSDESQGDVVERRETVSAWRAEWTARLAEERELARDYERRARRRKTA